MGWQSSSKSTSDCWALVQKYASDAEGYLFRSDNGFCGAVKNSSPLKPLQQHYNNLADKVVLCIKTAGYCNINRFKHNSN